jgi:DNA-binding protein YbaB
MSTSRLEAVLAMHGQKVDEANAQLDKAARFAAESERLRVPGDAAEGAVTVVVDGTGQPVDVRFARDVHRLAPDALGSAVLEALAQAKRRLSFRIEQLGHDIYGAGSPTADMFTRSYRDQFGYEEMR